MYYVLLLLVLMAACGLALFLLQRLFEAQQKLGRLHDDLRHNEQKLESEWKRLEDASTNVSTPDKEEAS